MCVCGGGGGVRLFGLLRCDVLYFESHDGIHNSQKYECFRCYNFSSSKEFQDSKVKITSRDGVGFPP